MFRLTFVFRSQTQQDCSYQGEAIRLLFKVYGAVIT